MNVPTILVSLVTVSALTLLSVYLIIRVNNAVNATNQQSFVKVNDIPPGGSATFPVPSEVTLEDEMYFECPLTGNCYFPEGTVTAPEQSGLVWVGPRTITMCENKFISKNHNTDN